MHRTTTRRYLLLVTETVTETDCDDRAGSWDGEDSGIHEAPPSLPIRALAKCGTTAIDTYRRRDGKRAAG